MDDLINPLGLNWVGEKQENNLPEIACVYFLFNSTASEVKTLGFSLNLKKTWKKLKSCELGEDKWKLAWVPARDQLEIVESISVSVDFMDRKELGVLLKAIANRLGSINHG
ncbi:hypothetical protein [Microseira sp. BLCC-F43]|uniref:hypothetical protein n=1 Tax=Microseira sp. BLCC-F43 TaxID=3153602 RepID=UPI0035B77AF4